MLTNNINRQDFIAQQFKELNRLRLRRQLNTEYITEHDEKRIELLLELEHLLNERYISQDRTRFKPNGYKLYVTKRKI